MGKQILIVGSGAREHALAWAIKRSPDVERVYVAPGNAGTAEVAENVLIQATDVEQLARFACDQRITLTVVGPDDPLGFGIVDRFAMFRRRIFGPTRKAARVETSKVFAKLHMAACGIPTAPFVICRNVPEVQAAAEHFKCSCVIKVDGLAAGKGVYVCHTQEDVDRATFQIFIDRRHGSAGDSVIVEERLRGEEISVHAITDGTNVVYLPTSQDHKKLYGDDRPLNPNTGGMGAIAPVPWVTADDLAIIDRTIVRPILARLRDEGHPFTGCLYPGLMMTAKGPMCLEFNARFGDPEACVILPLLGCDLLELLERAVDGTLDGFAGEVIRPNATAATVVLASAGYPDQPLTGVRISGIDDAVTQGALVFHAGTLRNEHGLLTNGGRVLDVTSCGDVPLRMTLALAYAAVDFIHFVGIQFRRDIGADALRRSPAP